MARKTHRIKIKTRKKTGRKYKKGGNVPEPPPVVPPSAPVVAPQQPAECKNTNKKYGYYYHFPNKLNPTTESY
jgi:hypothetical protein